MASVQVQVVVLDEVMQVAKGLVMPQIGTKACMKNNTETTMEYFTSHDYDGSTAFGIPYPHTICAHRSAHFTHIGHQCKGSKEVVVYRGTNNEGVSCAWLLAWYAHNNTCANTPNKVYVECGKKEKYDCIDWAAIENKLDAAGNHARYHDMCTGTTAEAKIDEGCEFASLAACFGANI